MRRSGVGKELGHGQEAGHSQAPVEQQQKPWTDLRERGRGKGVGHLCLFIITHTSGGMNKMGSTVQPEWKYGSRDRGHLAVHIKEVGSFSWGAAG